MEFVYNENTFYYDLSKEQLCAILQKVKGMQFGDSFDSSTKDELMTFYRLAQDGYIDITKLPPVLTTKGKEILSEVEEI